MLLVADVHGANRALARVARSGEPLAVLGDLLDLFDYRTGEGLMADLVGRDVVLEFLRLRERGEGAAARAVWRAVEEEHREEIAARFDGLVQAAYAEVAEALAGAEAYVIHGNADAARAAAGQPSARRAVGGRRGRGDRGAPSGLRRGRAQLPRQAVGGGTGRDGWRVLGEVDVLCTHVAPAVGPLGRDVISGRPKHSRAVLDYLLAHRPRWHYFGDVHQPQALSWRVGETLCRNVGYFRATGRAVRHG